LDLVNPCWRRCGVFACEFLPMPLARSVAALVVDDQQSMRAMAKAAE